jgi:hypothetical protein
MSHATQGPHVWVMTRDTSSGLVTFWESLTGTVNLLFFFNDCYSLVLDVVLSFMTIISLCMAIVLSLTTFVLSFMSSCPLFQ